VTFSSLETVVNRMTFENVDRIEKEQELQEKQEL